MTHRRPDPRQRDLDDLLRRALHATADSIEPAADGLERILTRIALRRQAATADWMAPGPVVRGASPLRHLRPAKIWLDSVLAGLAGLAGRFRQPVQDRPGWYGWLRPVAGIATGVLVVLAGYWAITALPQVISPSADNGPGPGAVGGAVPRVSNSPITSPAPGGTANPSTKPHSSGSPRSEEHT